MGKRKISVEEEIENFFEEWNEKKMSRFLEDMIPVAEAYYDVTPEEDWIKDEVGEENEGNVRLIRTAYLLSKLSDRHALNLCIISQKFKGLWIRIEESVKKDGVDN